MRLFVAFVLFTTGMHAQGTPGDSETPPSGPGTSNDGPSPPIGKHLGNRIVKGFIGTSTRFFLMALKVGFALVLAARLILIGHQAGFINETTQNKILTVMDDAVVPLVVSSTSLSLNSLWGTYQLATICQSAGKGLNGFAKAIAPYLDSDTKNIELNAEKVEKLLSFPSDVLHGELKSFIARMQKSDLVGVTKAHQKAISDEIYRAQLENQIQSWSNDKASAGRSLIHNALIPYMGGKLDPSLLQVAEPYMRSIGWQQCVKISTHFLRLYIEQGLGVSSRIMYLTVLMVPRLVGRTALGAGNLLLEEFLEQNPYKFSNQDKCITRVFFAGFTGEPLPECAGEVEEVFGSDPRVEQLVEDAP